MGIFERYIRWMYLRGDAGRRHDLIMSDDRVKRAINSDALPDETVDAITAFVHGDADSVTVFGKEFR